MSSVSVVLGRRASVVIASAAKQSSLSPWRDSGLLRCVAMTEFVGASYAHNTQRATDSFSVIALRRMRESDSTEYGFWINSKPRWAFSASTLL